MLRITIRAAVHPTEDPARVRAAIVALFPDATVEERAGEMVAEARELGRLTELVRSDRIPDSARGAMLSGLTADGLAARFKLGKQAAAAGRAHFGPLRSPLGDLEVRLEGDAPFEVESAIYAVAHDTTVAPELARTPPGLRPAPE